MGTGGCEHCTAAGSAGTSANIADVCGISEGISLCACTTELSIALTVSSAAPFHLAGSGDSCILEIYNQLVIFNCEQDYLFT